MSTAHLAPERLEYAIRRCKANIIDLRLRQKRTSRYELQHRQAGQLRAYTNILAILEGARDEQLSRSH